MSNVRYLRRSKPALSYNLAMEKQEKTTFIERIKKFPIMHWVLLACLLLFIGLFLMMDIIWTRDFAQGIPFITGEYTNNEIGQELTAYEISVYILFWLLTIMLIVVFIYELFFIPLKKIVHDDINRKEIMGNEVVDVHDTYKEKYENRNKSKDSSPAKENPKKKDDHPEDPKLPF